MTGSTVTRALVFLSVAFAVLAYTAISLVQADTNTLRVGAAGDQSNPAYTLAYGSFLRGMAALGYEQGRNFTFEEVSVSEFTEEALTRAYGELAARKVDIFVVPDAHRTIRFSHWPLWAFAPMLVH
jgi:hypothetical protein